jgi:hypothetical protein
LPGLRSGVREDLPKRPSSLVGEFQTESPSRWSMSSAKPPVFLPLLRARCPRRMWRTNRTFSNKWTHTCHHDIGQPQFSRILQQHNHGEILKLLALESLHSGWRESRVARLLTDVSHHLNDHLANRAIAPLLEMHWLPSNSSGLRQVTIGEDL